MEAVIHEDSPLASFLEGQGEGDPEYQASKSAGSECASPTTFAPRGLPTIRQRLHNALPKPLKLDISPNTHGVEKMQDAYSAAVNVSAETERFLEQFRFIIIGSQLLSERSKSAVHRRYDNLAAPNPTSAIRSPAALSFSLEGALVAAISPFLLAWGLQAIARKSRQPYGLHWRSISVTAGLFATVAVAVYVYARHKVRQRTRQSVLNEASRLTTASQAFDSISAGVFSLLAELEVISRGYEFGSGLPPVTRLEAQNSTRTTSELRRSLLRSVTEVSLQWIEAHHSLARVIKQSDLERYHDIYDVTQRDVDDCVSGVHVVESDEESLRHLRLEMARLFISRKIVLCDLLALPADSPLHKTWILAVDEMKRITDKLEQSGCNLSRVLERQESQQWGDKAGGEGSNGSDGMAAECLPATPGSPGREHVKMQLRRLDSMSQAVRALHTRMMLLRDETNSAVDVANESAEMSSILCKQYERIGSELRGLLGDWERGRSSMLLRVETSRRRSSVHSSGLKPPMSPADSLSGRTAVEGSPSDALRVLQGDETGRSGPESTSDEEVFEAVAAPPTRQRSSMTREEKIARMKEDRLRRAALQEKADANTNMLRELETVIKHRPHKRTSSRVISM